MKLVDKIEAVIKRMRWKAIFFDNDSDEEDEQLDTFGLKTTNTPRQVPEMIEFERELIGIVPKLTFKRTTNEFQSKLKQDIRTINHSDKLYVPADKTTNMYRMKKDDYQKILTDSITAKYKIDTCNLKSSINIQGKEIVKDFTIAVRFDVNDENNYFVTLKDHKDNFENNPTTRLINSAKNEIGRMSKVIIERINNDIHNSLNLNQWKSTSDVINWFANINEKEQHSFMVFDVKDFYPSISEQLLRKALLFANSITPLTRDEKR